MLYNKNWDAKTVTSDPFTLESLIAWLEKQPAAEPYCFYTSGDCLLTQYIRARGKAIQFSRINDFPGSWQRIAMGTAEDKYKQTFGAALARARKAAA